MKIAGRKLIFNLLIFLLVLNVFYNNENAKDRKIQVVKGNCNARNACTSDANGSCKYVRYTGNWLSFLYEIISIAKPRAD